MPNLKEMLALAQKKEALKKEKNKSSLNKRPLTRGVRPDTFHLERNEIKNVKHQDNSKVSNQVTGSKQITKHEPKLSQSEDKVEPKHEPKLSQSEDKVEPILNRLIKPEPKVEPQPEPIHKSKLSQSAAKVEPIGTFESLVGLQRDSLISLFDSCLNSGSKVSGAITISNLAISLGSTVAAVRKAVQRLEQKGYISRYQFKDGRGGWTKYEIPQSIYTELLTLKTRAKVEPNLSQSRAKVEPQPEPQPEPRSLVSKLDNINTNLTNTDTIWNLSITEHVERYGINSGVIKRAREISPNLEIDQVCNVIEKFMLCMEGAASKEIKNKIAFFLSLTKKAASGEDILPEIETETDRLMREMVIKAQKVLKDRAEMEEQLLEVSFQEWIGSLSSAEKLEIAPSSTLVKEGSHPHTQQFKNYYRENLWPQYKQIMLHNTSRR